MLPSYLPKNRSCKWASVPFNWLVKPHKPSKQFKPNWIGPFEIELMGDILLLLVFSHMSSLLFSFHFDFVKYFVSHSALSIISLISKEFHTFAFTKLVFNSYLFIYCATCLVYILSKASNSHFTNPNKFSNYQNVL